MIRFGLSTWVNESYHSRLLLAISFLCGFLFARGLLRKFERQSSCVDEVAMIDDEAALFLLADEGALDVSLRLCGTRSFNDQLTLLVEVRLQVNRYTVEHRSGQDVSGVARAVGVEAHHREDGPS